MIGKDRFILKATTKTVHPRWYIVKHRTTQRWKVLPAECALWYDQGPGVENSWKGTVIYLGVLKTRGSRQRSLFQTKHFQTLFWTPDVRLVDCPGLVMPNFVPMETQARIHHDGRSHPRLISVTGFERNPSHLKSLGGRNVRLSRIAIFAVGAGVWSYTSRTFDSGGRG